MYMKIILVYTFVKYLWVFQLYAPLQGSRVKKTDKLNVVYHWGCI